MAVPAPLQLRNNCCPWCVHTPTVVRMVSIRDSSLISSIKAKGNRILSYSLFSTIVDLEAFSIKMKTVPRCDQRRNRNVVPISPLKSWYRFRKGLLRSLDYPADVPSHLPRLSPVI